VTSSNQSADQSIPHGTIDGYTNHVCRCDLCMAAWARYMRDYRRRNRLTINARRRALRRARVLAATGEDFDFEDLLDEEMARHRLT